jgi:hypothetical protein
MTKTKLVALVVAAATTVGVWHAYRGDDTTVESRTAEEQQLVFDRIWIDHLPKTETDKVQIFILLGDNELGIFQQVSMWTGGYELFQYERDQATIRAEYPQTGEHESFRVKASTCHDVDQMDYCLDIKGASRGVAHYYSAKGWEIGAGSSPVAALAQVAVSIEHAVASR